MYIHIYINEDYVHRVGRTGRAGNSGIYGVQGYLAHEKQHLPLDPTVGLCLGPYGVPRAGGCCPVLGPRPHLI